MKLSPTAARAVAEVTWLGVLNIDELAPGLYSVVSRDHGGLLAAVEDLASSYGVQPDAVEQARKTGLIRRFAHDGELTEIWVGEEDCDWLTLVCASPAARHAWAQAHHRPGVLPPGLPFETWLHEHADPEQLRAQLSFWRPAFALTSSCASVPAAPALAAAWRA